MEFVSVLNGIFDEGVIQQILGFISLTIEKFLLNKKYQNVNGLFFHSSFCETVEFKKKMGHLM